MKVAKWMLVMVLVAAGVMAHEAEEEAPFELPFGLEYGAVFEWEVGHSDGDTDEAMATVELSAGWQATDWVRGDVVFLYEEGDTDPMDVDQLFLTLGNLEEFPVNLQIGRLYVPFGNLESYFISDPIALEFSEALKNGAALGFEQDGFSVSLSVFEADVSGADDYNGVLAASYTTQGEDSSVVLGGALIHNILDADGLTAALEDAGYSSADEVAGLNLWLTATKGDATLIAEYVQALDDVEINGGDTGVAPAALNLELGYALTDIIDVAAKYERSFDTRNEFAEDRFGVLAACTVFEHDLVAAGVAFEYMREEFRDNTDADIFTMQFAFEF